MRQRISGVFDGRYGRLVKALVVSNGVSLLLFAIRVWGTDNFRFGFLFWNLALAWMPLLLATMLVRSLQKHRWQWQNSVLVLLWLGFLPNSFYIISDFVHLRVTGEVNILFDIVLFSSIIFNAYVFGFMSLYLVHKELLRRMRARTAHVTIGLILLGCSFAIYLGRYLRWNTWDVVAHPVGLLFDVSDRFINPAAHPETFSTTIIFTLLLGSIYYVIYELVNVLGDKRS